MGIETIQTSRTLLRPFAADDIEGVRALMTDDAVMRFTGYGKPQPEERIQLELNRWSAQQDAPLGVWCVEDPEDGAFVGWCMLRPSPENEIELGFMFLASRWNRGYATEVATGLMEYAFRRLGVSRIIATVSSGNAASIRVLEKIGMTTTEGPDAKDLLHYTARRTQKPQRERTPDVLAIVTLRATAEGGRTEPAHSGYRPAHAIRTDTLTSGIQEFLDGESLAPGESGRAHITFVTPEAYRRCVWPGKQIAVHEGSRVVGDARIVQVLNPLLLGKPPA